MSTLAIDWTYRLAMYGREMAGRPFVWGETDCASLVMGGIRRMIEDDPFDVPRYRNARQARKALDKGSILDRLHAMGGVDLVFYEATVGDVYVGVGDLDPHGFESCGLVVDARRVLTCSQEDGVYVRDIFDYHPGSLFVRLSWPTT